MMSLKPRNIDFQETWANLKETVAGVVALRGVERGVWNMRFSDVYALCVAHPEPLADRLYDETRSFLEEHVGSLLLRVRGSGPLDHHDHRDGLLERYVSAWTEYSQGVSYLNNLYSYLNLQHVKRQKVSDAEIIYGAAAGAGCVDHDSRQLEVGELGLVIWERVLVRPLAAGLSARIVAALEAARHTPPAAGAHRVLRDAIRSIQEVASPRSRAPLELYRRLVLQPYLSAASDAHAAAAQRALAEGDVSHYMRRALAAGDREAALAARYLHPSSAGAARECYERAAVAAHLPLLHADTERLLREACDAAVPPDVQAERREDLRRMYRLLRPLAGEGALRVLLQAAHRQAEREGRALLHAALQRDEAHVHFVAAMLSLHGKYGELFADVFDGAQPFMGALDKACSAVVNSRCAEDGSGAGAGGGGGGGGGGATRAPELLARYCDALLRRRGAESDADARLAAAILVFKYIDDKDVFQKYYARALARRLIHQLSASMEQEEAMINRLKAACGYEFTNKLHRMFTDVAVSADLNAKFQQHLRDNDLLTPTGFFVQVLQAGAWPLGGAAGGGPPCPPPPPQLERPARLFDAFYRASFSGRRLAWLHHLCTGELRTRYTPRQYHVSATTPQCALLLCFETTDVMSARELRDTLQLEGDAWGRHVRPLIDAGLLLPEGDVCGEEEGGAPAEGATLALNLAFSCKRTKVRLAVAGAPPGSGASQGGAAGGGAGGATAPVGDGEVTHCDDDRKMYLQAALVRIMKQRKVLRHTELIQEVVSQARGSFAPSVAMIKKCIEALIDKQYLERAPGTLDTYSYLA